MTMSVNLAPNLERYMPLFVAQETTTLRALSLLGFLVRPILDSRDINFYGILLFI